MRAHLHLLSRLGIVLRDPAVKSALRARASREELMEAFSRAEAALPAPNGMGAIA